METLGVIGALVVVVAPIIALVVVGSPRKGMRIRLTDAKPVTWELPRVCAVTGQPTSETRAIRRYECHSFSFREYSLQLPFSANGWALYRKQHPFSLAIFDFGLWLSLRIPLLGGWLAFCWYALAAPFCGVIALLDLCLHRRRLITFDERWENEARMERVGVWLQGQYGLEFCVPNWIFGEAFLQLNPTAVVEGVE